HDHDRGQPRDGLRPQCRRPGPVHGRGRHRGGGTAGGDLRAPRPRAHARLHRPDPAALMSRWDRFTETFLNTKVMARYLPDILSGVLVTIGLAAGLSLALLRSLGIRPLNWLIIFIVDLFRSLPPLVVIVLIYFGLPSV